MKVLHLHIAARPGDSALARVIARLAPVRATAARTRTAGTVADPAIPSRRANARRLHRAQGE